MFKDLNLNLNNWNTLVFLFEENPRRIQEMINSSILPRIPTTHRALCTLARFSLKQNKTLITPALGLWPNLMARLLRLNFLDSNTSGMESYLKWRLSILKKVGLQKEIKYCLPPPLPQRKFWSQQQQEEQPKRRH